MELNRDQIVKALECCASDEYICNQCPIDEKIKDDCECGKVVARNALTIIKELTEENAKLARSCTELTRKLEIANLDIECKERICESYALQYGTTADKEVWLKKERADTVRKMQERLKAETITIQDHTGKLGSVVLVDTIDQIANELLEGSDET